MADYTQELLMALLATTGRTAFTVTSVFDMVDPTGKSTKQIKGFNLADGTLTQAEIVKKVKIDSGNFSRAVSKWIDQGIMFRLGDGRDAKLLHIFPLPNKRPKD